MKNSWTSQLIGRPVEAVEQWEGCPCVIRLHGGYRLQVESLWRVVCSGTLALTSRDEGQIFAGKVPISVIPELSKKLLGETLNAIEVVEGTGDLIIQFGKQTLQVLTDSSGYEAWQVEGPRCTVAVGLGGGDLAVWD